MGRPDYIKFRETARCPDCNTGAGFVVLRTTACFVSADIVTQKERQTDRHTDRVEDWE